MTKQDQGVKAGDEAGARRARNADRAGSAADEAGTTADAAALGRDDAAADRGRASAERDRAATARDEAARQLEDDQGPGGPVYAEAVRQAAEVRALAAADREFAAADRDRATVDRQEARADRARATGDRAHAAADRLHAAADRQAAAAELERAHTDALTGAYRRSAGEVALDHELARARRSGQGLVMAFVDVDRLKETNDRLGHAAGDDRLRNVVTALRMQARSYEPIVRYGGDEFVCTIAGITMRTGRARLEKVNAALLAQGDPHGISVGIAEMRPDDTLEALIERADRALIAAKGRSPRP